jgi:hypothetical protein
MLCAVTGHRIGIVTMALAAAAIIAASAAGCATSTNGSGTVRGAPTPDGSSGRDFPTGSAGGTQRPSSNTPTTTPSGSAGSDVHPVPASPVRTVTVTAGANTYVVRIWADVQDDTCFDHAHGTPIVTFLTQHPCTGLHRYLATTTVQGRPVGLAESATGFHGPAGDPYKYAGQFAKLEEQDGTGSINDLLQEGYRLPQGPSAIPSSEAFNVLGQDEGVTVWDAWYLDGPTPSNAKALIKMTQDLFLQF